MSACVAGPYRAYWRTAARWGAPRSTVGAAVEDAMRGDGPLGTTLTIAAEDPDVPGRTVDASTGLAIYPSHGMGNGSVRWPA